MIALAGMVERVGQLNSVEPFMDQAQEQQLTAGEEMNTQHCIIVIRAVRNKFNLNKSFTSNLNSNLLDHGTWLLCKNNLNSAAS